MPGVPSLSRVATAGAVDPVPQLRRSVLKLWLGLSVARNGGAVGISSNLWQAELV